MNVTAFEGVVENGKIRLPAEISLPEKARVFVVIPNAVVPRPAHIASPRLVHPGQAKEFVMEVIEEAPNARL